MRSSNSRKYTATAFFVRPSLTILLGVAFGWFAGHGLYLAWRGTLWPAVSQSPDFPLLAGAAAIFLYGVYAAREKWLYDEIFLFSLAFQLVMGMYLREHVDLPTALRTTGTALYLGLDLITALVPWIALIRQRENSRGEGR